jgi:hypothetical protein
MDCTIYTTATQERLISCVDNDIDIEPGDIVANDVNAICQGRDHVMLLLDSI